MQVDLLAVAYLSTSTRRFPFDCFCKDVPPMGQASPAKRKRRQATTCTEPQFPSRNNRTSSKGIAFTATSAAPPSYADVRGSFTLPMCLASHPVIHVAWPKVLHKSSEPWILRALLVNQPHTPDDLLIWGSTVSHLEVC